MGASAPPPQPPQIAPSPRRRYRSGNGAILLGVVSGFLIVGLVIAGVAYATGRTGVFTSLFGVTSGQARSTPAPSSTHVTSTPTKTANIKAQPTPTIGAIATPSPEPITTPIPAITPSSMYQTYTADSGLWSINVPENTAISAGTFTLQAETAPDVQFGFGGHDALTVYELPAPISSDQAQSIFIAILIATGATDVTIVQQPQSVTIGTNQWSEAIIKATIQGQPIETSVLYAAHGTGGIAISATGDQGAFATTNNTLFTPMEESFAFLA
jgi:hypothetical protein